MVEVIVFHSARPGVGKSTVVANLAALLAARGQRVGVVDANLQSGGMALFFGLEESAVGTTLNDFLLERCDGAAMLYDVTPPRAPARDGHAPQAEGRVLLIPASPYPRDLASLTQLGFRVERITDDLLALADDLRLDTLLIDTGAGLQEPTMLAVLSVAIAKTLVIMLRLDQGDYPGTAVTIDVARTLKVPRVVLAANQVADAFDPARAKQELEQTYQHEVVGLIPYTSALAALCSADLFVVRYPDHPVTRLFEQLAGALLRRADPITA